MQYQEVSTEPIACEYYKNTQNLHHKNLTVQTWGFLLKQELSHLGASSDRDVSCSCLKKRVFEIKCPFNYWKELKMHDLE